MAGDRNGLISRAGVADPEYAVTAAAEPRAPADHPVIPSIDVLHRVSLRIIPVRLDRGVTW